MATLIIPCDPRVVANQESICRNLLATQALESTTKDHDIIIMTPAGGKAVAGGFYDSLRYAYHSVAIIEAGNALSSSHYGLINAMFKTAVDTLSLRYGKLDFICPIIWLSERGNQRFCKDALDNIDAFYTKTKKRILGDTPIEIPACYEERHGNKILLSETRRLEGSFIIPHDFALCGEGRIAHLSSISSTEHFRVFLGEAMTGKEVFGELPKYTSYFTIVDEVDTSGGYEMNTTSNNLPLPTLRSAKDVPVAKLMRSSTSTTTEDLPQIELPGKRVAKGTKEAEKKGSAQVFNEVFDKYGDTKTDEKTEGSVEVSDVILKD